MCCGKFLLEYFCFGYPPTFKHTWNNYWQGTHTYLVDLHPLSGIEVFLGQPWSHSLLLFPRTELFSKLVLDTFKAVSLPNLHQICKSTPSLRFGLFQIGTYLFPVKCLWIRLFIICVAMWSLSGWQEDISRADTRGLFLKVAAVFSPVIFSAHWANATGECPFHVCGCFGCCSSCFGHVNGCFGQFSGWFGHCSNANISLASQNFLAWNSSFFVQWLLRPQKFWLLRPKCLAV